MLRVRPGGIGSIKAIKDERLFLGGDADAVVFDFQLSRVVRFRQTEGHGSLKR